MRVSSSEFYSGHNNIYFPKKNKKPQHQNSTPQNSVDSQHIAIDERKNVVVAFDNYSKKQKVLKELVTYTNQLAIDKYQNLETFEKREFAQSALGFSAYA